MLKCAVIFAALLSVFCAQRWATSAEPRVQFVNVAREAGITFKHENGASKEKLMPETFGSGVAWIDFDNDGLPDLFFSNGADLAHGKPSPGNVLYHNLGNGKFEDVTKRAGKPSLSKSTPATPEPKVSGISFSFDAPFSCLNAMPASRATLTNWTRGSDESARRSAQKTNTRAARMTAHLSISNTD